MRILLFLFSISTQLWLVSCSTSETKQNNPYKILELENGVYSTQREIKAAYKKKAFDYHPDRCTDKTRKEEYAEKFKDVVNAYAILGNLEERVMYDMEFFSTHRTELAKLRKSDDENEMCYERIRERYYDCWEGREVNDGNISSRQKLVDQWEGRDVGPNTSLIIFCLAFAVLLYIKMFYF